MDFNSYNAIYNLFWLFYPKNMMAMQVIEGLKKSIRY